jgi:prepilin-type N-terminal cleavage/methylation domain-containing protein
MHNSQGFTLIELMLVIVLVGALLAIAIPNFETLAYGPSSNRATFQLMGALNEARLKAIKVHKDVTVAFNQPLANQLTMTWNENGVDRTKIHRLAKNTTRVTFDAAPPGEVPDPDSSFVFTNLGLIEPSLGNDTGNIYVVDNVNGRRFHIATTLAGGIVERKWDGNAWTGPLVSYTP